MLAELKTEPTITRVVRRRLHRRARHAASSTPKRARWRSGGLTDLQGRVVDECLQLHGGYGYMTEYTIARLYADARVSPSTAGANEVMKELIARSL